MKAYVIVLSALAASACLTDEGDGPSVAASLAKVVSSDSQQAPAGGWVANPLRVTAVTEDGSPALRASVAWQIVDGPGGSSVSDTVTVTDGVGHANVLVRVGGVGTHTVRATLVSNGDQVVTFTVQSVPAPALSSVTPNVFGAGEVVVVAGQNFTAETRFEMGGTVVSAVDGTLSPTVVSVVAPPCLPGGTTEVRALFAGVSSSAVSAMYTEVSAPIVLAPGEYVAVKPEDVAGCATIPAPPAVGAEYLIAPQSRSRVEDRSVNYRFGTGAVVPTSVSGATSRSNFALRFHDFLRQQDRELPNAKLPEGGLAGARVVANVEVGDRRDFVACDKIGCNLTADFPPVRAEAMYVGTRATIYLDLDAPAAGFATADFAEIGALFDEQLYDVGTRAYGAESDVDGNGLVTILMTPVVNGLTPIDSCEVSFVTGFFFSIDLNPVFSGDPRSNQGEVFYALVPDPDGEFGCDHQVDRVKRSIPVTFVHEFQHMISYHQHVLLRGGTAEIKWLNEAMSHVAEELAALRFLDLSDSTRFNRFAIGNLANAYDYLENASATALLWEEGSGELIQRGAGWLFLRWMADQFGEGVLRRLSETELTGAANVEAAVGEPFGRLLTDWFLSNWVSDLPGFATPDRLRYTTWQFRTTYASLNEQAPDVFPDPFPIVPITFSTDTPFGRTGTLRSGSGDYYILNQGPGSPGRALEFVSPSGQPLGESASPVLNIIRIR